MTLAEVDAALGSLVGLTREEQRFDALEPVFDRFTADDVRFFARLLDHDLKINIGAKFALDALHPNAYEAFCKSNDLKAIICRWQNHELENELGKESTFATGLSLMTPIKPMLARSCKSFEDALKRCPQGMYAEIKYVGVVVVVVVLSRMHSHALSLYLDPDTTASEFRSTSEDPRSTATVVTSRTLWSGR